LQALGTDTCDCFRVMDYCSIMAMMSLRVVVSWRVEAEVRDGGGVQLLSAMDSSV
jgi:hypothetical protein